MTPRKDTARLAQFEGLQVSVALDDGSRIDDCQLVSAGRHSARTVWLVAGGADVFVPLERVVEMWETEHPAVLGTPKSVK